MKRSRSRRGAALIETVVALGVLGVGTAAVVALVTQVNQATMKSSFSTSSLNLFAAFAAQVRAASCDVAPGSSGFQAATSDPGLDPTGSLVSAPVGTNSALQLVGDFTGARAISGAPPMRLTYIARPGTAFTDGPPTIDIDVEVREITYDAVKDAATTGYWIRTFALTKVCTLRIDRGACGTPPCGRGEFY